LTKKPPYERQPLFEVIKDIANNAAHPKAGISAAVIGIVIAVLARVASLDSDKML
jgi:hypothetical protein